MWETHVFWLMLLKSMWETPAIKEICSSHMLRDTSLYYTGFVANCYKLVYSSFMSSCKCFLFFVFK